ncbi:hypothetical protein ACOSQ2_010343 [Xanthoceras sorbifolium]
MSQVTRAAVSVSEVNDYNIHDSKEFRYIYVTKLEDDDAQKMMAFMLRERKRVAALVTASFMNVSVFSPILVKEKMD